MKTIIIYASHHGCTGKAAKILAEKLKSDVVVVNLKDNKNPDLKDFDNVIIGGSIHAGRIQDKVKNFCLKNLAVLKEKRLGLFLCCMEEGEKAQKQFNEAYPAELRGHASITGLFGGEFNFDRMNFLERAIVKKVAGITSSVSKIKEDEIHRFAAALSQN